MTALLSSMFYAADDHSSILKCDTYNTLLQVLILTRHSSLESL